MSVATMLPEAGWAQTQFFLIWLSIFGRKLEVYTGSYGDLKTFGLYV
jgi:hypothetical protein